MQNDEVPFRKAGGLAGLAYNTIKRLRYQGDLPFPVYERLLPGRTKPKLYCLTSEILDWKRRSTTRVPAGA